MSGAGERNWHKMMEGESIRKIVRKRAREMPQRRDTRARNDAMACADVSS